MLCKRTGFLVLALFLFVQSARAQHSYAFIGNFKNYRTSDQSVTVHAQKGAVRLSYFKGIGFRVRYSFSGDFGPVFSYATVDSALHKEPLRVSEERNQLILSKDSVQVMVQKNPVRLTFRTAAGRTLFKEDFGAGHLGDKITHVIQKPDSAVYYGLGEKASGLNRTGRTFTFWNTDAPGYRYNQDPLYKTFPFYFSLNHGRAYGIYYDNSYKSEFDFGGKLKNDVNFSALGGELRFYVFGGPGMNQVLQEYTHLTGRSPLPPKWALGYQQSRYSYYPEKELYRVADGFRSRNIPLDVLYLDIDYMNGYRVFTWDPELFPTPQKMLSDLRDRGIKATIIMDPGVKQDSSYFMFNQGVKNNYFVKLPDSSNYIGTVWPGKTAFPDFSKPATRAWWGDHYKKMMGDGVAGIWTDMNEPAVFGGKTMPDIAEFNKDGRTASALEMHNLYGLLMARTTHNSLKRLYPHKRPFVITRAAFSGVQRYSSVWTGDNSATWDDVKLTMPMIMGLGMSGEPFAGFDIGGFIGSPDGEMYTRFLQVGIFMPFCRTHSSIGTRAQNPWSYGPDFTYINKSLIELRYKMLPQLYTAFYEHTRDGEPLVRPLVMEYQHDKSTYNIDNQFMLGDHLMVAPVSNKGASARAVYLPKGEWYRVFTDKKYVGGQSIRAKAPLKPISTYDRSFKQALSGVPMFVQAGSVLPMQRVQQYVGQAKIDTMQLNVYAGGSKKSKLYEDAGKGYDYKRGAYRLTTFKTTDTAGQLSIVVSQHGQYDAAAETFHYIIHGLKDKPVSVSSGKKALKFSYRADQHEAMFDARADTAAITLQK